MIQNNLKFFFDTYRNEPRELSQYDDIYCKGFNLDSVIMTFLISITIVGGLKQKIIIVLGRDLDFLSKMFMMVQITITASIIPVGSVYIHTVSDFNFLVYGASALMLISNIDN